MQWPIVGVSAQFGAMGPGAREWVGPIWASGVTLSAVIVTGVTTVNVKIPIMQALSSTAAPTKLLFNLGTSDSC